MCTGYILLPSPAAINNVPTWPRNFSLFSRAPGDRHYAGALISITRSGVPSALAGPTIHFAHCVRDPLPTAACTTYERADTHTHTYIYLLFPPTLSVGASVSVGYREFIEH